MEKIRQHRSTLAILGVLLLLTVSAVISFYVASVYAALDVTVQQNGPRIVTKVTNGTPSSYRWQRSNTADGDFADISGAADWFYDVTADDEGKYIRVIVDGNVTDPVGPIGRLVVFDISKGSVSLNASYSGYDSAGTKITGTHEATNLYVVTQSNTATPTTNNVAFGGHLPNTPFDLTLDGVNMRQTATNHNQAPGSGGSSTPTGGQITIPATGGAVKKVTLRLKGENQVRNITYYNGGDTNVPATVTSSLKITDINGDGETQGGSLYIPYKMSAQEIETYVNSQTNYNHWNAGIGGTDGQSLVQNLHLAGGTIQVVTSLGDNCTAIGAGGNGYCRMEISGGNIIAHCNGTGAAIGGGIGWNAAGGTADVLISGGQVYAKNHSQIQSGSEIVGGVAIGAGSSFHAKGSTGNVTIIGGVVEAYGTFGNGIGGGNSSTSAGGGAEIVISGGQVTATSIGGGNSKNGAGGTATVTVNDASGTAPDIRLINGIGGGDSEAGVGGGATIIVSAGTLDVGGSIGGGTGGTTGNGGDATVMVSGGTLSAASIGGGEGSIGGHGGAAKVTIEGGTITTGSIGGGTTKNPGGSLGYAEADISGGTISGQFLMSKGGTKPCTFTMTGGTLYGVNTADESNYQYDKKDGAAVYMDDPQGIVSISGGTIENCSAQNGGAIYMTDGTCTISGTATIRQCNAAQNGGAIYMGGGTLTVDGGSVAGNTAQNGGAVYMDGGTLTVDGGSITNNVAQVSGGGAMVNGGDVYVAGGLITENEAAQNGGGVAVNNGNYYMSGGNVDGNRSISGSGGGIYVSSSGQQVAVGIYSGSVSSNSSGVDGGALAVVGEQDGDARILVQIGVPEEHFADNHFDDEHFGEGYTSICDHDAKDMVDDAVLHCPAVNNNHADTSGGAIFVTGNYNTKLDIFCLTETDNVADGDSAQSNFMKVEGGTVNITTTQSMDPENENGQDDLHGHTEIVNTIYVTGGQMDIWGEMVNPSISGVITVDVTKEEDYFDDHRLNSHGKVLYKLLYYENFKDPVTGVVTGQYKEYAVEGGTEVTIRGNIYSHPGYTIKGWNTKNGRPDDDGVVQLDDYLQGSKNDHTGWYQITHSYLFDGDPIGDLILYAIWEANGYTVQYDPNVPVGETYTGHMPTQNLQYDQAIPLNKNQFGRPGYEFAGWCAEPVPNAGSVIYSDQQEVINLTTQEGRIVTLYAQWEPCDHNPDTHEYTYTVSEDGTTLIRECSCKGLRQEAHLIKENFVYEYQVTHEIKAVYSSQAWKPSIVYTALDGDELVDGLPYHAGEYTASITGGGKTAQVTFEVRKADQEAPPKPSYTPVEEGGDTFLYIKPVIPSPLASLDSTYTSVPQYRIVYYVAGVAQPQEWQYGSDTLIDGEYALKVQLNVALTNYYVEARYSGCDNYNPSPEATADRAYFLKGNVKFTPECGEGVVCDVIIADGEDDTVSGITVRIYVKPGYFFPQDYAAVLNTVAGQDTAVLSPDGAFSYEYQITNIPKDCELVLVLPAAKKLTVIDSAITEKQVFDKVTGTAATISRDSAYTIYFHVENYHTEEYASLVLQFDTPLPAGSTIILQDRNTGGYYWLDASGKSTIALTEFIRMGDKGRFALRDGNMDLQFVIDFSRVNGGIPSVEALETSLVATVRDGSRATGTSCQEVANVEDADTFRMETTNTYGELQFERTPSYGIASKWDGHGYALVLTLVSGGPLPADARLSVSLGNTTIAIYENSQGDFVYSMPDENHGTLRVSLVSDLLDEGTDTYRFRVQWIAAESLAEKNPMNGELLVTPVLLTVSRETLPAVSLKIQEIQPKRLYNTGDTLTVLLTWVDLPQNHTLEVVLLRKSESGEYSSTGVSRDIYFTSEEGEQELQISLAGNDPGSYCLQVVAKSDLVIVARADFYFLVQEAS